jgi:hypothetical protein
MMMPDFGRKGIGLIFPNLDAEMDCSVTTAISAVTQTISDSSAGVLGRVLSSL